jgi:hypothetical protein
MIKTLEEYQRLGLGDDRLRGSRRGTKRWTR